MDYCITEASFAWLYLRPQVEFNTELMPLLTTPQVTGDERAWLSLAPGKGSDFIIFFG